MENIQFLVDYLFRWGHFLFGITWIGLLYYFNFVQGEYFKEADPAARSDAFVKLVPKALWFFRWGAAFTFLTGVALLLSMMHTKPITADIVVGALLGTFMFLNVWLIIWPNQKILIASNQNIIDGKEPLAEAASAAPKAALASRTNTLFSVPMLFFMGSSAHFSAGFMKDASPLSLGLAILIVLLLEANAVVGKQGPMTTVKGVILSGFALTAILVGILFCL